MAQEALLSSDILAQARAVGGEFSADFDRQVLGGDRLPLYSVVGRNSRDSSYRGVMDGRSVEVSRAGSFRRKNADGEADYFDALELVIIDARTQYVIFKDNQVIARGISTKGLTQAVWTESDGCVEVGASCESSPYMKWNWERNGGREGKVLDAKGYPLAKEDLATGSLQLWCWDIAKDEFCILQFSGGAIRHYREAARDVECQGVKIHSILWKITTTPVDNGASAAPSYVPVLDAVRVLKEGEFTRADEQRAQLVVKMSALAPAEKPRYSSLKEARQSALPSAFAAPPNINLGPAVADPNDVFAGDN